MEEELIISLIQQVGELKEAVNSQGTEWHTLITAVVAFLAALVPNAVMERNRRRHEARTLRSAIVAEMFAISQIIHHRGYIESMRQCAEYGTDQRVKFNLNVPADYARVYHSSVAKIGLLKPHEGAHIIYCYNLLESVVQDVIPGGILAEGEGNQRAFTEDAEFLEKALQMIDEFVKKHGSDLPKKPV